jgi:hypothetical protein
MLLKPFCSNTVKKCILYRRGEKIDVILDYDMHYVYQWKSTVLIEKLQILL